MDACIQFANRRRMTQVLLRPSIWRALLFVFCVFNIVSFEHKSSVFGQFQGVQTNSQHVPRMN